MNSAFTGSSQTSSNLDCPVAKLPDRRSFLRLRSGRRFSTDNFTLQAITTKNSDADVIGDGCRVGYTVTTRVGNAVVRNRIKRRLRAAVREVFPEYGRRAYDYALIARRNALNTEITVIKQDLKRALDHVHANRAKGGENGHNPAP